VLGAAEPKRLAARSRDDERGLTQAPKHTTGQSIVRPLFGFGPRQTALKGRNILSGSENRQSLYALGW
jgi:hypothetical protein